MTERRTIGKLIVCLVKPFLPVAHQAQRVLYVVVYLVSPESVLDGLVRLIRRQAFSLIVRDGRCLLEVPNVCGIHHRIGFFGPVRVLFNFVDDGEIIRRSLLTFNASDRRN